MKNFLFILIGCFIGALLQANYEIGLEKEQALREEAKEQKLIPTAKDGRTLHHLYLDTIANLHYEHNGNTWIKPAGKDWELNSDPHSKLLWESQQKQRVIVRDKALEEFDDGEVEDYYESIRD